MVIENGDTAVVCSADITLADHDLTVHLASIQSSPL